MTRYSQKYSAPRRSDLGEHGFISAFSALTLVVVILLCFIAMQFSLNTIKSLRYSRIVAAVSQNQKSAPSAQRAFLLGAAIAELNGLKGSHAYSWNPRDFHLRRKYRDV
jgi:hypothetical protein